MKKTGAKRVADLVRINLYPSPKDKERLVSLVDETIAATKK